MPSRPRSSSSHGGPRASAAAPRSPSWLHGVAYRTAQKAQAQYARRLKHEPSAARPEIVPPDDPSWREVQQVLHDELNALSERHRAPLALCYLEGQTLDRAAIVLGLSRNTLKARLERGRAVPASAARAARTRARRRAPRGGVAGGGRRPPAGPSRNHHSRRDRCAELGGRGPLAEGVLNAMRITKLRLATTMLAVVTLVGLGLGGLARTPADKPREAQGKGELAPVQERRKKQVSTVAHDKLTDRRGEEWVRITGRVNVIDARTLEFEDGTRLELWYVAPRLNQMAMNGEKLYPAGKEAAEFLRKCIGERPVTCFHQTERNQYAVTAYVGDTSLNDLMVVNGWAYSVKMPLPSEFAARENKRGLWRGQFTDPTDWEAGVRLPGEPPPPRIADEDEARLLIKTYHEREPRCPPWWLESSRTCPMCESWTSTAPYSTMNPSRSWPA